MPFLKRKNSSLNRGSRHLSCFYLYLKNISRKITRNMSNDDSFNDSDEIFNLYSSKKVTDTFKAQLKKIAANNHQINNVFSHVNKDSSSKGKEKSTELELPETIEKEKVENIIKKPVEPIIVVEDESPDASVELNDNTLEDSIEVITECFPRQTTRKSERLRTKRIQSRCGVNDSWNTDSNLNRTTRGGKSSGKRRKKQERKPINEITLDDSPQRTETDDELNPELSVKVIWKSVNVKKFHIRKFQKLSYIFDQLSKEENIPADKIILTFNNVRVSQNDTPDSLNLQVYHFLDGGVLSELTNYCQTQNKQTSDCSNSDSVTVKFQDANKKIIQINLNRTEKLKVGMIKCSEQLEVPLGKIRFFFDGELVQPNETPSSLGLENEEIIDIKIST